MPPRPGGLSGPRSSSRRATAPPVPPIQAVDALQPFVDVLERVAGEHVGERVLAQAGEELLTQRASGLAHGFDHEPLVRPVCRASEWLADAAQSSFDPGGVIAFGEARVAVVELEREALDAPWSGFVEVDEP